MCHLCSAASNISQHVRTVQSSSRTEILVSCPLLVQETHIEIYYSSFKSCNFRIHNHISIDIKLQNKSNLFDPCHRGALKSVKDVYRAEHYGSSCH